MTGIDNGMALQALVPGQLWHATQALRFGPLSLSTRMTVLRRPDGSLWVHSPIQPTPDLCRELDALGEVRQVVAPNRSHHLFFQPFLNAYPRALGYIAPGLSAKRPALAGHADVVAATTEVCGDELRSVFVEGLPVLNETVWLHAPSRTLIVTDLLFCFGADAPLLTRAVARALGVHRRLAMSHTMRLMVRDRNALRRSVARILALAPERIVVAHDQIIDDDVGSRLKRAFAWLE
jgi:hypothetical protein